MTMTLPPPGTLQGDVNNQLRQCYTYLFLLHQRLNTALGSLDKQVTGLKEGISAGKPGGTLPDAAAFAGLKALIVQNATYVKKEMDRISTELKGSYVAVSDFGTYVKELNARLEADPEALTQYYSFLSRLEADIGAVDAEFQSYLIRTEGYIRTGVVDYEGEIPVYGVAVGQGLITTEIDGQTVVSSTHFRSTFTARRLSFWQGDTEVAYLSDNRLYITNITVLGSFSLGGNWAVTHNGGFTIRWVGGDVPPQTTQD